MTKPISISQPEVFAKLWMHECLRVFHDRLINSEDKLWFTKMVCELTNVYFRCRFEHDELFTGQGHLLFGDLLKLESSKNYEEIKDHNKLKSILQEFLEDYNISATRKMNLVFFEDAIEHIVRISRVMRQPRGNMMLIGVGGSGKQSLTKLSCHMLGYYGKQVEITKNFGTEQFRDFLKELMFSSGIDGQSINFILTDTQIVKETFLEDINNLLNTGDIPNLFLPEDYDKIINMVRPIVIEMKRVDTQ